MIKITFECSSMAEAQNLMDKVSHTPVEREVVPANTNDTADTEQEQEAETPPAKTTKKKSAKKKTRKTTKPETQDDAPADDTPTKENVRDKLAAVGDKIDFGAVREIVQRFGANGLKELDESQYADVIEACEAKLAE